MEKNLNGLTKQEVKERISIGEINKVSKKFSKTYAEIFIRNIFTFFNILLCAVFVALVIVKADFPNMFFMGVVLANTTIGIFQEISSKRITDKLSLLSEQKVIVRRNSFEFEISSSELVKDDIFILKTGNEVPVDGILLDGSVEVNESLLTGEAIPVKKVKGNTVLAGTFIVSGEGYFKAEKVGNATYAAGLQKAAKQIKGNKSELILALNKIIKIISYIVIPLAALTFLSLIFNHSFESSVVKTAGSMVGMIPAGMFLLTSLALEVGVIKLSKKNVLTHDMYSLEMLARTDVLCFDKTGTLTDGNMTVDNAIRLKKGIPLTKIMGSYLRAVNDKNQTSIALMDYYKINHDYDIDDILAFSSKRKFSAVKFKDLGTFYLGAPEMLIKKEEADDTLKEIFGICEEKQQAGQRALLLCHTDSDIEEKGPKDAEPYALFIIRDTVRKEVGDMLNWFVANGVEVKIISGDNPVTVSAIANIAGVKKYNNYISLEGMSEEQVKSIASKYTVFGRVSPEQKAYIVEALKAEGKTVTISGDGVNDILAMKKADCSVAMGNGSDAARSTADLVLLENDFSAMASIVCEGRRVINNIQRSSTLFLMKTFFTVALTLITMICSFCGVKGFAYPFGSGHLMLFELFCIGIPSFFLALQPDTKKIEGSFLKNILAKALPAGMIMLFSVLPLMILQYIPIFGINETNNTLMFMMSFTFSGGFVVFCKICKPFDAYRSVLYLGMLLLTIISFLILPLSWFGIEIGLADLTFANWMTIAFMVSTSAALYYPIQDFSKKLLALKKN